MPPRKKKTSPCREHFPDGIPDGQDWASCEHGAWTREDIPDKAADGDDESSGE